MATKYLSTGSSALNKDAFNITKPLIRYSNKPLETSGFFASLTDATAYTTTDSMAYIGQELTIFDTTDTNKAYKYFISNTNVTTKLLDERSISVIGASSFDSNVIFKAGIQIGRSGGVSGGIDYLGNASLSDVLVRSLGSVSSNNDILVNSTLKIKGTSSEEPNITISKDSIYLGTDSRKGYYTNFKINELTFSDQENLQEMNSTVITNNSISLVSNSMSPDKTHPEITIREEENNIETKIKANEIKTKDVNADRSISIGSATITYNSESKALVFTFG